MNQKTYQLTLNFDQILDLVKQLPESDKIKLSKVLILTFGLAFLLVNS